MRRGRPRSALGWLVAEPRRFTFDAALRVLSFARRRPFSGEAARFTVPTGTAFPGAEVELVQPGEGGAPPLVTLGLMGLTGPAGVLPRHYTDAVTAAQRRRSSSLARFLDVLAQRMIGAFGAAGAKYRLHRAADAALLGAGRGGEEDAPPDGGPVGGAILALTGYGMPGFDRRLPTGYGPLQHYAGLFSAHPRSADRLEAMLSDWLARPVEVRQFAGSWLPLPPDQRSRLPLGLAPGAFHRLGDDAAIGVRAWDQQARIVLRIGPLDRPSFERLLPDGKELRQLVSLARSFLGFEVGFAVNPVLEREAVPPLRLAGPGGGPGGEPGGAEARLGWNAWLPHEAGTRRRAHAAEAMFEAELVEAREGRAAAGLKEST